MQIGLALASSKTIFCLFLAFLSALPLAGCVTPLQEPKAGEPRARLRIIYDAEPSFRLKMWVYQGGQPCLKGGAMLQGFEHNSEHNLHMPDPERIGKRNFAEIYVSAGKRLGLQMDYSVYGVSHGFYCYVGGGFIPDKDQDYEILALVQYGCSLSLRQRFAPGIWLPVPMHKMEQCP
jgi:hypothetical protein